MSAIPAYDPGGVPDETEGHDVSERSTVLLLPRVEIEASIAWQLTVFRDRAVLEAKLCRRQAERMHGDLAELHSILARYEERSDALVGYAWLDARELRELNTIERDIPALRKQIADLEAQQRGLYDEAKRQDRRAEEIRAALARQEAAQGAACGRAEVSA